MPDQNSIEIETVPTAKNLYVFFGGLAAGLAIPPFEFYNAAKILNENKLFVRDFRQVWYQNGLRGYSSDIPSTAEFISGEIEKLAPEKVFFVGNSMGGFAAILFSHLIGRGGDVIAFSPQTFISPWLRIRHLDYRWLKKMTHTHFKSLLKPRVWDLKPVLLRGDQKSKISIFVSRDHRLDHLHGMHLRGVKGVSIHSFQGGGHGVVRVLRDNGSLPSIMSGNYREGEEE